MYEILCFLNQPETLITRSVDIYVVILKKSILGIYKWQR